MTDIPGINVAAPSAPAAPALPAGITDAPIAIPNAPIGLPGGPVSVLPGGGPIGLPGGPVAIPNAPISLPGGPVSILPGGGPISILPGGPIVLPGGPVSVLPGGGPIGLPGGPVNFAGGPFAGLPATAASVASMVTTGAFADQSFKTFLTSNIMPTAPLLGTSNYNSFLTETGLTSVGTTDYASYFQVKAQSLQTLVATGLSNIFATADYKQGGASSFAGNSLITTPMVLVGTMPNQAVIGGKADDVLICKAIGAVLNGGAGLNTVVMSDDKAKTQLVKSGNSWVVTGPTSSATLNDVQRVKLSDTTVALDVDGKAGDTAKLLGAVFGKDAVKNKAFVGIGLDLFDKGGNSFEKVAELALGVSGARTNDEIVTKLWTNIIGAAPSNADIAPFVKMLENGVTPGALCKLAAENSINLANIDLVGLAKTGIEFTPPVA